MATANKNLLKQYRDLVKNLYSFTRGQAALVEHDKDDDYSLEIIRVHITPSEGHYRGGRFQFELDLSDGYPECAPRIRCLNRVYHPNIDVLDRFSEGDICLNLLDELWTPDLTLEDYIQGLLFLFYNPNIDDALNAAFSGDEEEGDFHRNVRQSMRGAVIDGFVYDNVLVDGYVSDDEREGEHELRIGDLGTANHEEMDGELTRQPGTTTTSPQLKADQSIDNSRPTIEGTDPVITLVSSNSTTDNATTEEESVPSDGTFESLSRKITGVSSTPQENKMLGTEKMHHQPNGYVLASLYLSYVCVWSPNSLWAHTTCLLMFLGCQLLRVLGRIVSVFLRFPTR